MRILEMAGKDTGDTEDSGDGLIGVDETPLAFYLKNMQKRKI